MSESVGIDIEMDAGFDDAVAAVTAALKEEGFGVLTRIDVHSTLKEKLDVDFRPYAILGACNPVLANKALNAKPEVGLMLPCNVTVEQTDGGHSLVRIVNARAMMAASGLGDDPLIGEIGGEAAERLGRVASKLRSR
jgi:uncharacterized protein (DUF302 family)